MNPTNNSKNERKIFCKTHIKSNITGLSTAALLLFRRRAHGVFEAYRSFDFHLLAVLDSLNFSIADLRTLADTSKQIGQKRDIPGRHFTISNSILSGELFCFCCRNHPKLRFINLISHQKYLYVLIRGSFSQGLDPVGYRSERFLICYVIDY